ncbi:Thoeris anti-defense Tad2 family protein, partial [Duncaniella freteri]|uniref:Thoeris anti-defense Tad2 family protein n=1 Tax=Duncaniella freteri TaxID=2530391 RepID=UPI003F668E62
MHQYIRTQVVKAEPMTYGEAYKSGLIPENSYVSEYDNALGYRLVHMDGFVNWKPKEVFDEEYEKVESMTFGLAIKALKAGHKVARKGWNGKGMFLWLKPAATVKSEWCKDPMLKKLADDNGGTIEAAGTICMFTAQHQILTGWLAS